MSTPTPTTAAAPAAPAVTTDPATALGAARLLVSDVDPAAPTLTDAQYTGLFALRDTPVDATTTLAAATTRTVRLVAADALETISTSEALIGKVVTTAAGVSTDGTKVAAELRARAVALRALVADTDARDLWDGGGPYDVAAFGDY